MLQVKINQESRLHKLASSNFNHHSSALLFKYPKFPSNAVAFYFKNGDEGSTNQETD